MDDLGDFVQAQLMGMIIMAKRNKVTFELMPGTVHTALWCLTCNLPSMISSDILKVSTEEVHKIGTVYYCDDCGEWNVGD